MRKKVKQKKLSQRLKEIRSRYGFTTDEMAFILGMRARMYEHYESGRFDSTYSIRKERIISKLLDMNKTISDKIIELQQSIERTKKQ